MVDIVIENVSDSLIADLQARADRAGLEFDDYMTQLVNSIALDEDSLDESSNRQRLPHEIEKIFSFTLAERLK